MTKQEKDKCEKLLDEALENLYETDLDWMDYEMAKKSKCYDAMEACLRKFENHGGYAEGIYQALAVLGYKSEKMTEFGKKL